MTLVWNCSSLNVMCEKDLPLLKGKMENWLQLGKESYQLVPPKTLVKIPQRHEPEEIPALGVFHVLLVKFLQPFQSKNIQQKIDIANVYFFKIFERFSVKIYFNIFSANLLPAILIQKFPTL